MEGADMVRIGVSFEYAVAVVPELEEAGAEMLHRLNSG